MGTGSDKKGKDKKRIHERDCKNCKAGRQTSECKSTLVRKRKKERRRLRGEKDDGDGGARHKEKRKAKEKVDGELGRRRSRSSEMEITVALWRPRVGRCQKKKKYVKKPVIGLW